VDATIDNTNDLGTFENIELTLPSKTKRRTEPKELGKSANIQVSGTLPNKKGKELNTVALQSKDREKEIFLKDDEFVLFFNNKTHSANLQGSEDYLNEI
jgi:hypothetical protein